MALPPITALPTAPSRGQDSDTFNANADAFIGALPTFRTELNAFGQAVVDATVAASAIANYNATSTSSLTVGTGSKTFAIQTGKLFVVGQYVTATSAADSTKWVHGQITAHNSTTGSLTVNVGLTGLTGTVNDWVIGLSGPLPPAGWLTIATVNTTSGTLIDFTGIPTTYSDLMLVFNGVSHNFASNAGLNMSTSDGTTYSSGSSVSNQIPATGTWYGSILIPGYNENGGRLTGGIENHANNTLLTPIDASRSWRHDGGMKAVRFSLTSGSFDLGSVVLKGRR